MTDQADTADDASDESMPAGLQLAEFVDGLRNEFRRAQRGSEPGIKFEVGPVEVEFSIVTTRETGADAKVRFWVVDAGGKATWTTAQTQRVTLVLTPVGDDGRKVEIDHAVPTRPR
jgi:hypothetical protein